MIAFELTCFRAQLAGSPEDLATLSRNPVRLKSSGAQFNYLTDATPLAATCLRTPHHAAPVARAMHFDGRAPSQQSQQILSLPANQCFEYCSNSI